LANVDQFTKFFHFQIPEKSLHTHVMKVVLTLTMFQHYLVKLENCNCCRFKWHTACETTEFIM